MSLTGDDSSPLSDPPPDDKSGTISASPGSANVESTGSLSAGSPEEFSREQATKATTKAVDTDAAGGVKTATTEQSASGRPVRKRTASARSLGSLEVDDESDSNVSVPAEAPAPAPRRKKSIDKFDIEHLMTSPESLLTKVNLHVRLLATVSQCQANDKAMMCDTRVWTSLRPEQKATLAALAPQHVLEEAPDGSMVIPNKFLKFDQPWRQELRFFQEDLAGGRMDPKWLAQGEKAMEERANGAFDKWKEGEYESFWGQKQKFTHGATAGLGAKHKLDVLSRADVFKIGDVWRFTRTYTLPDTKEKITIDKECKVS